MRKILIFILTVFILTGGVTCVSADEFDREREYLAMAVANSYGETSFGVKVAISAVAVNLKKSGLTDSLAGSVAILAAEGEFRNLGKQNGRIDEETSRICRDAVDTAVAGADPTGGALNFRCIERKRKADLRFDDSSEDAAQWEMWCELGRLAEESGCGVAPTIIDGFGFY